MKPDVGTITPPQWDMTSDMEEVGWSQAGVWRSERDHFINDDIMLGVTDTLYVHIKRILIKYF